MTKKFSIDWPPRFEPKLDFDTSSEKKAKAARLSREARRANNNNVWNKIPFDIVSKKQ